MSVNLTLVAATMILVGTGVYLLLERSLSRVLVGLVLLSNGVNIGFLVVSGPAGRPPFADRYEVSEMSDPLPQAFVLTAIVITLATTAFVLAMSYRSWQLSGNDDVQDDVEDDAIRRLARLEAADRPDLMEVEPLVDDGDALDDGPDEADAPDVDGPPGGTVGDR